MVQTAAEHDPAGKTTLLRDVVGLLANTLTSVWLLWTPAMRLGVMGQCRTAAWAKLAACLCMTNQGSMRSCYRLCRITTHRYSFGRPCLQNCQHCCRNDGLPSVNKGWSCICGGRLNAACCIMSQEHGDTHKLCRSSSLQGLDTQ